MTYLAQPRLHFSGHFQADVSTVNNDVRHFDTPKFQKRYQKPQADSKHMNGWWNPEGTGAFRLIGCRVTGGVLAGRQLTHHTEDPVIGMSLAGANERVCGKIVDLDPQQQMVSELWGLQVRLTDGEEKALFNSQFKVAAFMDLWRRQQATGDGDQTLASYYHSVLQAVDWQSQIESPLLNALRETSANGLLSIRFNVFGFNMNSSSPDFTLGRLVGTIGPAFEDEPDHFVFGRQMQPDYKNGSPVSPCQNVYGFPCQVQKGGTVLTADLGNALPITNGEGELVDLGDLSLVVLKQGNQQSGALLDDDAFVTLGEIPYRGENWYEQTAGVVDFAIPNDLSIKQQPLALVGRTAYGKHQILVRETQEGLYVRADQYVARLNPGDQVEFRFFASQYGAPWQGSIALFPNNSMIGGGAGPTELDPPVTVPKVGAPSVAIHYPATLSTDQNGRATLTLVADDKGPGNPRDYIDGQLYGIGYRLANPPEHYIDNPWLFISTLVWDKLDVPEKPEWYKDIQPILKQYGNLYPIMSRHLVDLGEYDSVCEHLAILKLAFSLPVSDPNYMPVTRDLSDHKREMILRWIDQGAYRGAAPEIMKKAAMVDRRDGPPPVQQKGGKSAFLDSLRDQ